MFNILRDFAKVIGSTIGVVTGPIIGISADVIASALGLTVDMVREAIRNGCETYEDIKEYWE